MVANGEQARDGDGRPGSVTGAPSLPPATLREHLPGLEPERQVSDWGRSELVEGALDRFLYDFLFHYWFRVEVEGITNVPPDGPGLLIANRAGALPTDAAMIAKAIREHRPSAHPVHFATDRRLGTVPGLDMLLVKAGAINAHPANLHRLMFDEGQLVLAFAQEGPAAVLRERYRLAPFVRLAPLKVALRAGVPIVPVAVMGSEEAAPVLGRLGFGRLGFGRLRRLPVAAALPLPAKVRIRFLEPVVSEPDGQDNAETLAADLRSLIQENLLEMLSQRRSVWLG